MARHEADKEDLIAEATAMVERAEFFPADNANDTPPWNSLTIGFRDNGSMSVYFDQDPFYQFDADGLLRRAYEAGFLYRSEVDTLAKLHRERSDAATTLCRTDLTSTQLAEFRQRMDGLLTDLLLIFRADAFVNGRQVSDRGDIVQRTITAIEAIQKHGDQFLAGRIAKRKQH